MQKQFFLFLIISIFYLPACFAQSKIFTTSSGSITFSSDAPLELINASTKEMRGKFDITKKQFAFTAKINSFAGFNSSLQREHFNENYMESMVHPNASFAGKVIEDIDFSEDGTYDVRAKGSLLIHGVLQERIIKCTLVAKKGKINISSKFTVLLSDHNIPIPKVVHEKLASEIKVEVKADMTIQ